MNRARYCVPLAAAAALSLILAAPAYAVITVLNDSITSDGDGDNINVTCTAGFLTASGVGPGSPCATLTAFFVEGGAGEDQVDLTAVTAAAFPALRFIETDVDEDGAEEPDTVTGSPLSDDITGGTADVLLGGAGNDLISGGQTVSAGPGDDTIFEFFGNGPVSGGDGDDRFVQFAPTGGIDGGLGTDSWEIDFDQTQVSIAVDATFTFTPSGMEVSAGGMSQLFAASGIEELYITFLKDSVQTGDATTFPGVAHLRGVSGVDVLIGGAFDDRLFGGGGNDTLTGNGGADLLVAGEGNDTVNARDGVADRIDCGGGTDTVVADAADVVVGCESVQLPTVPPAPPAPAPAAPDTGAIKGPDSVTKPGKAKFKFSSPTAGATFQCKLDKKAWKACTSPYTVKSKKLDPGKHKLQVRAVVGGVVDATPSKKKFKVKEA